MALIDQLATEHSSNENVFEHELVRVDRAYIAGFVKAREMAFDIVSKVPGGASLGYIEALIGMMGEESFE